MDLKEIRKKSTGELQKQLRLYREQMRDLRFKIEAKQHKDVRELRETRKIIARILTVMKEKQILKEFKNIKKSEKAK